MAREKKTYRLSEYALEIIEKRDRKRYPSANDFVEQMIIESEEKRTVSSLKKEMEKLQESNYEIKQMLRQIQQKSEYPMTTL